jgi:hypothetical protein
MTTLLSDSGLRETLRTAIGVAVRAVALVSTVCVIAMNGSSSRIDVRSVMPPRSTSARTLVVAASVDHLDVLAREPTILEHPDGTLFVAGYGEPLPTIWKSGDRGATWARVNVGGEADGAIGNSDVDLAVAPDGTLYFATMGFDRNALEGTHINIGISSDVGATWSWTSLSKLASMTDRGLTWHPTEPHTSSGTTAAAFVMQYATVVAVLGSSALGSI